MYKITIDKAKYTLPLDEWGEVITPEMFKDEGRDFFNKRSDNALKKVPTNAPPASLILDGEEYDISMLGSVGRKAILESMRKNYVRLDDGSFMTFSNAPSHEKVDTPKTLTAHETIESLSTLSEMGLLSYGMTIEG